MLGSAPQLSLIAQMPLAQAGCLLFVIAISFAIITLVSSACRFHKLVQLDGETLGTAEDSPRFFYIQVARYLSKIHRGISGFGIVVVQCRVEDSEKQKAQAALLSTLKNGVRSATDKACLFRDDCVAAIVSTDEKNMPTLARRIVNQCKQSGLNIRAGSSYCPTHGQHTQEIIHAAADALETVRLDCPFPFCAAPTPEAKMEKGDTTRIASEIRQENKHAALDPLTGVLKPTAVASYMRKYLSDLRLKKNPAALLCVGINRMDQIINLHGEFTADELLVGVSKILQALTRDRDLIGRCHRDDMLVLLPCTLQQGQQIAMRLREAIQKEMFVSGNKPIKASVSIGITAMPEHGRNLRELFRYAYRALEVVRDWNTSACLTYHPAQHGEKKRSNETRR